MGKIEPTITIKKGSTFATAKFNSTFTPGTTAIAATASGYATVQTSMITVAPIPYKLAVYGLPPVLPSNGAEYDALAIQLQDSSGSPAKAPLNGIQVTLSSSNGTIASVPQTVTILEGQTYTIATITSNQSGSATITVMASGYISAHTTINTEVPSTAPPTNLRIHVAPPKTLADNTERPQIVVQLLTATGRITHQAATTVIQLSSSNENVGEVQNTLEIPPDEIHGTALFSSTFKAGETTITAAATDLSADTEILTTVGPIPTKIAVYCTPSVLPADNEEYNTIQVQLQDPSGKPALDPDGDVTVSLFSSDPTVGAVSTTLVIPYGKTYSTTTFTSTYVAGSTTITAQTSGYPTGEAQMITKVVDQAPLKVTVTASPSAIAPNMQTNITAYVTIPGGTPATSATLKFTSSKGGTFTKITELGEGYYTATFTVPDFNTQTTITINATASKTDYMTSTSTTQLTIIPDIKVGTIQLCITDENGQPIGEALISTVSEPPGMVKLTDITNSTGYVSFPNAIEGTYTFNINKLGYYSTNQTIPFTSTMPVLTISITKGEDNQAGLNPTLIWLIITAIAVVIVIAVAAYWQRRRTAAKFKVPKKWTPPQPPKLRIATIQV